MEINELIETRKSVRNFKSTKPDWRTIIECLDSTRFAPMAGNQFTPRFILVDKPAIIKKIAEASEQEFIQNAHYVVVVCSNKKLTSNAYGDRGEKYIKQQTGAAMQNFLLKINEAGLATCWVGHFYDEKIKHLLRIPEEIEVEALFPIGYAMGTTRKKRKIDLDSVLYFNEYKKKRMNPPKKLNI